MGDFLIQVTLSNLVVATILAVIAWGIQSRVRSASLTHLLWSLVLIKMVTPPLLLIPVFEVPSVSSLSRQPATLSREMTAPPAMDSGAVNMTDDSTVTDNAEKLTSDAALQTSSVEPGARTLTLVFAAWLLISTILLLVSAIRIIRFHWLLKANSRVHSELSTRLSAEVAAKLGLRRHPKIVVTSANIAPFVWWMAGRSVIVVSKRSIQELNDQDLRLIMTHEMAHIKRRDHWFRWVEWAALTGFWWNPVMWWAHKQLRLSEEIACDELVLETTAPEVHQYASSLLHMAELLASSAIRPPVVASAINSGGNLERRLKMMVGEKTRTVPPALRMAIVAVAACVFPLGLVAAQDLEAVERRLGGAVEAGELSLEQANLMMEALRRSNTDHGMEAKKRRYMELVRKIEVAVDSGKLSREEAEEKLIAVRREMFEDAGHKDDADAEMEAKKRRYMEFVREIEMAVDSGKLSEEEAEEKLIAVRREMFEDAGRKDDADAEMEAKKRRYMEFAREIEMAVDSGKLSEEEAEEKLIAVRREMFEDAGHKDDADAEMEAKKRRYMEFVREIEMAVDSGKLSEEEAEEKLIAVRREMFEDAGRKDDADAEMEAKKRRYMEFAREIEMAVDSGKLSEEEAEEKLIAVRREMFEDAGRKDDADAEMEAKKRRYMEFVREIEAAVESGRLSEEEAEQKLIAVRREMFEEKPEDRTDRD